MGQQNVNFQKKQKFRHKKQKYFFLWPNNGDATLFLRCKEVLKYCYNGKFDIIFD